MQNSATVAVRHKPAEERVVLRQEKAKPVFDELEAWLMQQQPKISGKSKLAEAIRYALGRMPKARGPILKTGSWYAPPPSD